MKKVMLYIGATIASVIMTVVLFISISSIIMPILTEFIFSNAYEKNEDNLAIGEGVSAIDDVLNTDMLSELSVTKDRRGGDGIMVYDYDFDTDTQPVSPVGIYLDYDTDLIDSDSEPEDCILVGYYDEENDEYLPVRHKVVDDRVLIYPTHFSRYSVFTFENVRTKNATIIMDNLQLLNAPRNTEYTEVLNEIADNEGVAGESTLNSGIKVALKQLGISGNGFTLMQELFLTDSPMVRSLEDKFLRIGVFSAVYQLADDMINDNKYVGGNLAKNITYLTVAKWGTSALKLGSVAVFAVELFLQEAVEGTWNKRQDQYRKIYDEYYDMYHKAINKSPERYLYDEFKRVYDENVQNGGDMSSFKAGVNAVLDDYVNEIWNDNKRDEALFGQAYYKVTGTSAKGWGGIGDDLKSKLSSEAKQRLLHNGTLNPVLKAISNYIAESMHKDLIKELTELRTMMNKEIELVVYDDTKSDYYKNGTIILSPTTYEFNKKFFPKLNSIGRMETKFTLLAYMQMGCPDSVEVYREGNDPSGGNPDYVAHLFVSEFRDDAYVRILPPKDRKEKEEEEEKEEKETKKDKKKKKKKKDKKEEKTTAKIEETTTAEISTTEEEPEETTEEEKTTEEEVEEGEYPSLSEMVGTWDAYSSYESFTVGIEGMPGGDSTFSGKDLGLLDVQTPVEISMVEGNIAKLRFLAADSAPTVPGMDMNFTHSDIYFEEVGDGQFNILMDRSNQGSSSTLKIQGYRSMQLYYDDDLDTYVLSIMYMKFAGGETMQGMPVSVADELSTFVYFSDQY